MTGDSPVVTCDGRHWSPVNFRCERAYFIVYLSMGLEWLSLHKIDALLSVNSPEVPTTTRR